MNAKMSDNPNRSDGKQKQGQENHISIGQVVSSFKTCGRGTQKLLLEHGAWRRLHEWTRSAIASKDVPVLTDIMETLLSMPTSASQLQDNKEGVPSIVRRILDRVMTGESGFKKSEEHQLKDLCTSVLDHWQLIREAQNDHSGGEGDPDDRLTAETEDGQTVRFQPIADKPGYAFMELNGVLTIVTMHPFDTPHLLYTTQGTNHPTPPSQLWPASQSSSNEEKQKTSHNGSVASQDTLDRTFTDNHFHIISSKAPSSSKKVPQDKTEDSKKRVAEETERNENGNKGECDKDNECAGKSRSAPKKMKTHGKSRADRLLEEMLEAPCLSRGARRNNSTGANVKGKTDDEKDVPQEQDRGQTETEVVTTTRPILSMIQDINVSMENAEKSLADIIENLGTPKKIVRWWGMDGLTQVHEFHRDEIHEPRGCVKEKWVLLEPEGKEEEDSQSPKAIHSTSNLDQAHLSVMPWKLRKIHFVEKTKDLPLEITTKEVEIQRVRECMVVPANWKPGTKLPETLVEADDEEDQGGELKRTVQIPVEDVDDKHFKYKKTEVYKYNGENWPTPRSTPILSLD